MSVTHRTGWQKVVRSEPYINRHNAYLYAQQLARYMSDPSTIIVMTKREHGVTMDREEVQKWIDRRKRVKKPIWENSAIKKMSAHDDGKHYKVPGLVKLSTPQPKPRPANIEPAKPKKKPDPLFMPEYIPPEISETDPYYIQLIKMVAIDFKLTPAEILGEGKTRRLIHARAVIIFILRERNPTVWSFPRIGKLLGGRDHSSILNIWNQRDKLLAKYEDVEFCYRQHKRRSKKSSTSVGPSNTD